MNIRVITNKTLLTQAVGSDPLTYAALKRAAEREMKFMYGRSLREETLLSPLAKFWGAQVRAEIVPLLQETEHRGITKALGFTRAAYDVFSVSCKCDACDKTWRFDTPGTWMQQAMGQQPTGWTYKWVSEMLLPWYEQIGKEACYGTREGALLAEWLTRRLAGAGERGMPYVQLIHDAVEGRLVPPAEADAMLRKLGFVEEWVKLANSGIILPGGWDGQWTLPILTLPEGHPLRTW